MASPTSFPPHTRPAAAPSTPFCSSTFAIIFVVATAQSGVVGDGFHSVALPAASDNDKFLHKTHQKLALEAK